MISYRGRKIIELDVTSNSRTLTLSTNRHQFDPLAADEVQSFIHVGDLVETHLAFVGFGQPLTWKTNIWCTTAETIIQSDNFADTKLIVDIYLQAKMSKHS